MSDSTTVRDPHSLKPFCPMCGQYHGTTGCPPPIGRAEVAPKWYGWICPQCGRGNSPFTNTCPCMGGWTGVHITCGPAR